MNNSTFEIMKKPLHLAENKRDLSPQEEELSMFYHRIIHDIKAPIASILGLIRLSKTKITEKNSLDFFSEIEKHFHLLETEIFSSLKSGAFYKKEIDAAPVYFDPLIEDVYKLLSHSRSLCKVNFKKKVEQSRGFNTNRQLIFSIFQNIIDNSIKHGRDSDDKEMTISIKVKLVKEKMLIQVEDDGKGISQNTKMKLFQELDSANDLFYKGSGLGLFIIKKNVEKLNGSLLISENKGKGSKFTILIPEFQ